MTDVRNNIEEGIISKFINIQGVREKDPLFEGTAQNNRVQWSNTGFGGVERDGNLIRLEDT